jgi:GDP-L-fucose synthase
MSTRILVTGSSGFLGQHVVRHLARAGADVHGLTADNDLRRVTTVERIWTALSPQVVVHCAAKAAGIDGHGAPADFFYDNALLGLHVLHESARVNARVVLVGSAAMYHEDAEIPTPETALWDGLPHDATRAYGMAKLMAWEALAAYRTQYGLVGCCVVPTNLYGPGDHSEPGRAHVVSALVRRFEEARMAGARTVTLWGSPEATRDLLYVEDAARAIAACVRFPAGVDGAAINLATGQETTIGELARLVAAATGFAGEIAWDQQQRGVARRSLDITLAGRLLGWAPRVTLEDGLAACVRGSQGDALPNMAGGL